MQGCKERHLSQDYISRLLAAASDHLWAPLPERLGEAKPLEDADATAPAAADAMGSDTLVPHLPGVGGAVEAANGYSSPKLYKPEQLMTLPCISYCRHGKVRDGHGN